MTLLYLVHTRYGIARCRLLSNAVRVRRALGGHITMQTEWQLPAS